MGCVYSDDSTGKEVVNLLDQTSTVIYGKPIKDVSTLIKSDGAAIGVSRELEMEENEGCDMNDGNNIGSAAIGRLTRSRSKVVINEFKCCLELIEKFYKTGKHLSMSSNSTMRFDAIKKKHFDKIPSKHITVDLSTTHISAVRMLVKAFRE